MSKISLKSVDQILSAKEMKNVLGGSGGSSGGSCPSGEDICYCNGVDRGCVCSVQECIELCY